MQDDLDPWSQFPYWGSKYVEPFHNFRACVDDSLRYLCGYSYVVEVPSDYTQEKKYPLIIFLHGGISVESYYSFLGRDNTRNSFYEFENDKYIIAAPIKLEIDWEPDKIIDVIDNITLNLNVDKANKILDWVPKWDFQCSVQKTVEWYKNTHEGQDPFQSCLKDIFSFNN